MKKYAMMMLVCMAFVGCMTLDAPRTMKFGCVRADKTAIQQEVASKLVGLGYSITYANEKLGTIQAERENNATGSMAQSSKMVLSMSTSGDTVSVDVRSVEKVNGATTVMTWSEENARGATLESFSPVVELLRQRCSQ